MHYEERRLTAPKRTTIPNVIVFIDTETTETSLTAKKHELKFKSGCMIIDELTPDIRAINRRIFYINSIDDFYLSIEELSAHYPKLTVFGHNLGFDLRILGAFHRFTTQGYLSSAPIINNRIFIWRVSKKRHTINFIDTANLGVTTVDELGRIIGLPKLNIDFDVASKAELDVYCLRDCEIIERFVIEYLRFIVHYNLGGFKPTIASQALHTYLYRFYKSTITLHRLPKVLDLELSGYHGGRTEVFQLGTLPKQDYTILDINSMYAHILTVCGFPTKLIRYIEKPGTKTGIILSNEYYHIAEVVIKTDQPIYPKIINNRLCFPIGKFTTVLHQAELEYALKHNHILKAIRIAVYEKSKLFDSYAEFFLSERHKHKQANNDIWSNICKLYNNSLYGKFGQKGYKRIKIGTLGKEQFGRQPYTDHIRNRKGQFIIWNGQAIDEYQKGIARHSSPAIAGAVTAYARMLLWKYITLARLDNVYYSDTDSLMVNDLGFEALKGYIDSTQHGLLKVVGTEQDVRIFGLKDYKFGKIEHIKGIKSNARRLKSERFEQWQFSSVRSWLNSGGQGTVILSRVIKQRKHKYSKGIPDDNTGRVKPFSLD